MLLFVITFALTAWSERRRRGRGLAEDPLVLAPARRREPRERRASRACALEGITHRFGSETVLERRRRSTSLPASC